MVSERILVIKLPRQQYFHLVFSRSPLAIHQIISNFEWLPVFVRVQHKVDVYHLEDESEQKHQKYVSSLLIEYAFFRI